MKKIVQKRKLCSRCNLPFTSLSKMTRICDKCREKSFNESLEKRVQQRVRMRRPCYRCDVFFTPSSKMSRICDECRKKSFKEGLDKKKKQHEKILKENLKKNAS